MNLSSALWAQLMKLGLCVFGVLCFAGILQGQAPPAPQPTPSGQTATPPEEKPITLPALERLERDANIYFENLQKGDPIVLAKRIGYAVILPGSWLLSFIWLTPNSWMGLLAAILLSWWLYATALRLMWIVPGRIFGYYDPNTHHEWLRLVLPWRLFYPPFLTVGMWWRHLKYGSRASAHWASQLETMHRVYRPGRIFLGRYAPHGIPLYQPVGLDGERHLVMIAGAGSGKTTLLMTMLGLRTGNSFVIDCDGQIINALGERIGKGDAGIQGLNKKVCVLDPYGLSHHGSRASWNALAELDKAVERHGPDAAVRFAETLSEALIKNDDSHQPFFANAARNFMTGLILFVWDCEMPERRTLVRVRELLTTGLVEKAGPKENPFAVLLWEMSQKTEEFGGVIARAAGVMTSSQGSDGKNHPRSTAIEQTRWLDIPEVAAICENSDFHCEDLKTGNVSVFVVAPVTDIQTKLSGWVRALTLMTMYAFQNIPGKMDDPCLFALDEMASLGRIESVETAAPVFRKYGVRLLAIAQDLEKLKQVYPKTWGGFLGNSEAVIWLGTDHQENIDYLFKVLGNTTRKEKIDGSPWWQFWGEKVKARYQRIERPLMYPNQLREFLDKDRANIIITRNGKRPLRLKNDPYYKALPVKFYAADRNFGETMPRALLRKLRALPSEILSPYEDFLEEYFETKTDFIMEAYLDPFWEGHGGLQASAASVGIVLAVIAVWLLALSAWPEDWAIIAVGSLAALVAGAILAGLIASALVDGYKTASAVVVGNFDSKHPYPGASIRFFCKIIAAAATWIGLTLLINYATWHVDSMPLGIFLLCVDFVALLIALFAGLVALVPALCCIAPLFYIVFVAAWCPIFWLARTRAGSWAMGEFMRLALLGLSFLPATHWIRDLLSRWSEDKAAQVNLPAVD